jgi:hypothetical protein
MKVYTLQLKQYKTSEGAKEFEIQVARKYLGSWQPF